MSDDRICLECSHRADAHDGIGCTEESGDMQPCYCTTAINMPGDEPTDGVYA